MSYAPFKSTPDFVKDNPGGMDKIDNPHNFSSNPGFLSTQGMLGASSPSDPTIQGTSARGSLPRPVRIGPSHPVSAFNGR